MDSSLECFRRYFRANATKAKATCSTNALLKNTILLQSQTCQTTRHQRQFEPAASSCHDGRCCIMHAYRLHGFMPKIQVDGSLTVPYLSDDAKLNLSTKISRSGQQRGHQQRGVLVEVGPQRQKCSPHDLDAHHRHKQNQAHRCAAFLMLLAIVERNGFCAVTQPC